MKTIKFYTIRPFEFRERRYKKYETDNGIEIKEYYITHKIKGDVALLGEELYFGFTLDGLKPGASGIPPSELQDYNGDYTSDAECDDSKFYLRKSATHLKFIDGEFVEETINHVRDYFNKGGLTYIKFDPAFAGGQFERQAEKILSKEKTLDTHNMYYRDKEFLNDMAWL